MEIIRSLISIYIYIIIAAVIMSWLVNFGIINLNVRLVANIWKFLVSVTEPVFKQVRRIIPPIGGLDLSPIIIILLLGLLNEVLQRLFPPVFNF